MNWLTNVARPRIKSFFGGRDTPDNLWHKCSNCGEMIFHRDIKAKQFVCPSCDYHMKIGPTERFEALFDGDFEKLDLPQAVPDPLKFRDSKRYPDKVKDARNKTGQDDVFEVASGTIASHQAVVAVQNFNFMGGSLGMAAGEAILAAAEKAVALHAPLILFAASGGARMQEGILSLMQMPRSTIAVQMLRDVPLPYIVVLTDPTSGGVTASYAMLGDIQIAEPGALIAFTGPRVIEQTIREKLPDGFQRAEFLLEHGMVDMIVHRHEMRDTLARIIGLLMAEKGQAAEAPLPEPTDITPAEPAEADDSTPPSS